MCEKRKKPNKSWKRPDTSFHRKTNKTRVEINTWDSEYSFTIDYCLCEEKAIFCVLVLTLRYYLCAVIFTKKNKMTRTLSVDMSGDKVYVAVIEKKGYIELSIENI